MTRGGAYLLLGLVTILGCGGRTEALFDDQASGGNRAGGGSAIGVGGAGFAGFAASSGAPSVGGSSGSPFIDVAGSAGSAAFAGSGAGAGFVAAGGGGAAPAGGAPSVGGFPNIAGAPAAGGFSGVAGGGSGPIIDACVAIAVNSCQKCLCSACSSQVVSCFSNVGCALVFACVEKTGCKGLGCYTNATCGQVIDQYGGFAGSALGNVFQLVACSVTSQVACTCN